MVRGGVHAAGGRKQCEAGRASLDPVPGRTLRRLRDRRPLRGDSGAEQHPGLRRLCAEDRAGLVSGRELEDPCLLGGSFPGAHAAGTVFTDQILESAALERFLLVFRPSQSGIQRRAVHSYFPRGRGRRKPGPSAATVGDHLHRFRDHSRRHSGAVLLGNLEQDRFREPHQHSGS